MFLWLALHFLFISFFIFASRCSSTAFGAVHKQYSLSGIHRHCSRTSGLSASAARCACVPTPAPFTHTRAREDGASSDGSQTTLIKPCSKCTSTCHRIQSKVCLYSATSMHRGPTASLHLFFLMKVRQEKKSSCLAFIEQAQQCV